MIRNAFLLGKALHVSLGALHEDVGIAGVTDELHTQVTPLLAALDGVSEAANLHALGRSLGDDALDALHHLGVVDLAHTWPRELDRS